MPKIKSPHHTKIIHPVLFIPSQTPTMTHPFHLTPAISANTLQTLHLHPFQSSPLHPYPSKHIKPKPYTPAPSYQRDRDPSGQIEFPAKSNIRPRSSFGIQGCITEVGKSQSYFLKSIKEERGRSRSVVSVA